ncbi:hypothetical protein KAW80_02190 [Candidatus Babeliales bacterium]|nr:hypothetical protein [Candidatus Babeliales bacterium]
MNKLLKMFVFLSLCINSLSAVIIKNTTPFKLGFWHEVAYTDTKQLNPNKRIKIDYAMNYLSMYISTSFRVPGFGYGQREIKDTFQLSARPHLLRNNFGSIFGENDVIEIQWDGTSEFDMEFYGLEDTFLTTSVVHNLLSLKDRAALKLAENLQEGISSKLKNIMDSMYQWTNRANLMGIQNNFLNFTPLSEITSFGFEREINHLEYGLQYGYAYGMTTEAIERLVFEKLLNQPIETALLTLKWLITNNLLRDNLKRKVFLLISNHPRFANNRIDFDVMWITGRMYDY